MPIKYSQSVKFPVSIIHRGIGHISNRFGLYVYLSVSVFNVDFDMLCMKFIIECLPFFI